MGRRMTATLGAGAIRLAAQFVVFDRDEINQRNSR
jgi:hypothetical protein